MLFQISDAMLRCDDGANCHRSVIVDSAVVEASVGYCRLVLHADHVADAIAFDGDRFPGEHALRHELTAYRVKRMKQANGKRRTRAQAGTRRQVTVVMNIKPRFEV